MGAATVVAAAHAAPPVRREAALPTSMAGWRDAWVASRAQRLIDGRPMVDGDRLTRDRADEAVLAAEDQRWAESNLASHYDPPPPPPWEANTAKQPPAPRRADTAVRQIADPVRARMAAAEEFDLMDHQSRLSAIATMVHHEHKLVLVEYHTADVDGQTVDHLLASRMLGQGGGGSAWMAAKPERGFEGLPGLADAVVLKSGKTDEIGTGVGHSKEPLIAEGRNSAHARSADTEAVVWMPVAERKQYSRTLGREVSLTSDLDGNERGTCVPRTVRVSAHPAAQQDLESVLGRACTIDDTARMTVQMVQATRSLRDEHGVEVVHRDVKPANILVVWNAERERVEFMLADYDFARTTDEGCKPWEGTVTHRAPEQRVGWDSVRRRPDQHARRTFDGKVDSYAIAATSYEMLSGRSWRSSIEVADASGAPARRLSGSEEMSAIDIQADTDSGYRPVPVPAAYAGDDEASRRMRDQYQAWELLIAAAADHDEKTRTPPVGLLAHAQAFLAEKDRDLLNQDDLKQVATWLDRPDRGPHDDRVAALDRAAISALLADDRVEMSDKQRLSARLQSLQSVTPTLSTDFLARAHAQDLANQEKLLDRWGGQSVARMVDHRDHQSRISMEEFKSRSASASADRARSEQESVRRPAPDPPPDDPPKRDDFRM